MNFRISGSLILFTVFLYTSSIQAEPPSQPAQKSQEITNSIGMKLVLIPAGEFMMGGQESAENLVKAFPEYKRNPDYFKDEYPPHRVRISKSFYMGKHEVTIGDFKHFVEDTGYKTEPEKDGEGGWGYDPHTGQCDGRFAHFNWRNTGFLQTDDHPVVNITWNDAVAFCQWLSRKEGKTYRLPTEAQWEYACLAQSSMRYHYGNSPDELVKAANVLDAKGRTTFPHVQELTFHPGTEMKFTIPVGSMKSNQFGLYDMHGNVWEWCADWYGADYYSNSPVDDPAGPDSGKRRVRRGGGWNSFPLWARASFRNWNKPQSRCVNLGFRVAGESLDSKQ